MLRSEPFQPKAEDQVLDRTAVMVRRLVLAALAVVLALAAGNRWLGWGRDYEEYYAAYNLISPSFLYGASRFELGYEIAAWVFAVPLSASFPTFYTVTAFVALAIKFALFERYLRYPLLAALIYILLFYPILEYTQIRASLAIALGYASIHFVWQRRFVVAVLLAVAAFFFHSSTVILTSLGLALMLLPGRVALIGAAAIGGVLLLAYSIGGQDLAQLFAQFNPLVFSYIDNANASESINAFSVSNILFMLTIAAGFYFRVPQSGAYGRTFLLLSIGGIAALFVFRDSPVIALRFSELLLFSTLFYALRPTTPLMALVMPSLLLVNGLWFTYRATVEGTLGS
ncbi:EpsG family protein [Qipengyuania thermophila]|uniref:EpsG family protein n=1 Tax=Qipengyuania thermophila TaxID=2509361 RepID=UPI0013EBB29B|nr:EpsG family protein [Qipengyuania thermophila]